MDGIKIEIPSKVIIACIAISILGGVLVIGGGGTVTSNVVVKKSGGDIIELHDVNSSGGISIDKSTHN